MFITLDLLVINNRIGLQLLYSFIKIKKMKSNFHKHLAINIVR